MTAARSPRGSALREALEPGRARDDVAEAVARAQPEERPFDVEQKRALEHPQMMLESHDGRRVEGDRATGREMRFDELAAESGSRRRDNTAAITARGILPRQLLGRRDKIRRPRLRFGHQARKGPAVDRAELPEHRSGRTQLS